ncbi:MAG: hypothetical protein NVS4B5_19870 [Vulcanimicrobiaceae bacterium]
MATPAVHAAPGASAAPGPPALTGVAVPIAPAVTVAPPSDVASASPAASPPTASTTAPLAPVAASPTFPPPVARVQNVYVAPAGTQSFPNGPFANPVVVPQFDRNTATYLSNVMGGDYAHFGKLQFATNVTGPTDGATPIYIAHDSDPTYTIHCMYYSHCPIEGVRAHVPVGAIPAGRLGYTTFTDDGSHDQHMAVRNVDSGVEIDTWLTPLPNGTGGTLNVGYGGQYALTGGGFNQPGGATAAGFALGQGRIRPVDLLAGRIAGALFLVTPCENGHVYPASGDDGGTTAGCPPLGAHVWLDSTPAEVAAAGVAPEFAVILNAMHEFGGYIGDRCTSCALSLALEGGVSYTAFDQPNPWSTIASHFPSESPSGPFSEYHITVASGTIDLARHLHFLTN